MNHTTRHVMCIGEALFPVVTHGIYDLYMTLYIGQAGPFGPLFRMLFIPTPFGASSLHMLLAGLTGEWALFQASPLGSFVNFLVVPLEQTPVGYTGFSGDGVGYANALSSPADWRPCTTRDHS